MNINATDTTQRSSGKGFPADLLKVKEIKTEDGKTAFELGNGVKLKVGEYVCMEAKVESKSGGIDKCETIFAYAWFDSGMVNFMTTVDYPEDGTVPRRSVLTGKAAEEGGELTRERPERESMSAAVNYNMFMAGVDTNDNMRAR